MTGNMRHIADFLKQKRPKMSENGGKWEKIFAENIIFRTFHDSDKKNGKN